MLQAQVEAKERELEAAQERAEAAERAATERDRELAGKMDASAEEVRWQREENRAGSEGAGSANGLGINAGRVCTAYLERWVCVALVGEQ